ncbi:MAG: hypothetical protein K6E12_05975 [Saccharofermentans sp.]|nr:hypothetical protein [Saccharofermentans sp.]
MINTVKTTTSVTSADINELRSEAQRIQKRGAPYMMASVIIWALATVIRLLPISLYTMNLLTFCSSMLLVPLALVFSKITGADIFRKTNNPVNKLGILCTCNQMLYILIAMWAFSQKPECMLMIYAMIFGAHLIPFSWIYQSRTYLVMSLVITIGSLVTGSLFGDVVMGVFLTLCQVVTSSALLLECRKNESKNKAAGL